VLEFYYLFCPTETGLLKSVHIVRVHFILTSGNYSTTVDSLEKGFIAVSDTDRDTKPATTTEPTPVIPVEEEKDNTASTTKQSEEPTLVAPAEEEKPMVKDFFSCIDVTGIILESYPRQCIFDDITFIEEIEEVPETGDAIELTVEVGPEIVDCVGISDQKCLVVDGDLFYDAIVGFEHEVGYRQQLRIQRTLAWGTTDPERIPADAGLYKYELLEVLTRKQEVTENNCVVAGCSSQLCISKEEAENGGGISTCEFREEYACYRFSECRTQETGACGWTMTPEVTQCLANPPTLE